MSGDFVFKEADIAAAARAGLQEVVKDALSRSYQYSDRFKTLVAKTVHDMEGEVEHAVKRAYRAALVSPEFQRSFEVALLKGVSDKFGGAFTGILQAMAKQVANTPEMQEALRAAAVQTLKGQH